MVKWIIGAIVGVIVVICTFLVIDPNTSKTSVTSSSKTSTSSLASNEVSVEISGAVITPGTYTLDITCTLGDLIQEAGGLLTYADETCFDVDVCVENYDYFYIPYEAGYSSDCVPTTLEKVNINTATEEELASINGISTTLASKIVAYREANGSFQALEDVMKVSGIGTKTYERIRDYICLK